MVRKFKYMVSKFKYMVSRFKYMTSKSKDMIKMKYKQESKDMVSKLGNLVSILEMMTLIFWSGYWPLISLALLPQCKKASWVISSYQKSMWTDVNTLRKKFLNVSYLKWNEICGYIRKTKDFDYPGHCYKSSGTKAKLFLTKIFLNMTLA